MDLLDRALVWAEMAWQAIGPYGRMGAIILVGIYAVWAIIYLVQSRLLYFTDPTRIDPETLDLVGAREVEIRTPDRQTLVMWHAEARDDQAPHILFLHGNRRALWRRARFFKRFLNEGWGLTALAHRGFNGSTGKPSERKNVEDAILVCQHLKAHGIDQRRIVMFGESLGSGTAVQAAARCEVGGVVLMAPYDSLVRLVWEKTLFLLPRRIVRDQYQSIAIIGQIKAPLLWLHGDHDRIIPLRRGRRLYDAAGGPKYAALVKGANHFGLYNSAVFDNHIRLFVEGIVLAAGRERPVPASDMQKEPVT